MKTLTIPDRYAFFTINSNKLVPRMMFSDLVLCQQINPNNLEDGRYYILENDLQTFIASYEDGRFAGTHTNKHKFPDKDFNVSDFKTVYRIRMITRNEDGICNGKKYRQIFDIDNEIEAVKIDLNTVSDKYLYCDLTNCKNSYFSEALNK